MRLSTDSESRLGDKWMDTTRFCWIDQGRIEGSNRVEFLCDPLERSKHPVIDEQNEFYVKRIRKSGVEWQ